jgi:hypothetical protein
MSIVYPQHAIAPRATLAVGAAGALVGGVAAAARNLGKVKKNEMTQEDAIKDSLKEAGTTGLSTAAATAVVGALGLTGVLSIAGLIGVAVGVKYVADKALDKKSASCADKSTKTAAEKSEAKTAAKAGKTAAKKTADVPA